MGYENVGKVWDAVSFRQFLSGQNLTWADGITLHHTGTPDLSQRPKGWTIQHMRNLEHWYKNSLGWSAGPHLFIDEDQIFGLSSLERRGVHAKSFNANYVGIEVLGNYDSEEAQSGRGLECWEMAAKTVAILLERMGKTTNALNFHRDDPRTSKTCPGSKVSMAWFASLVEASVDDRSEPPSDLDVDGRLDAIEFQVNEIRASL